MLYADLQLEKSVTSEGGSGSTMAWGKEADVDVSLYRFAIPEMTYCASGEKQTSTGVDLATVCP